MPEPPESTPTPHRSPSQGLAEDTVAGAQQACAPQIARSWCWPRRASKYEKVPTRTESWAWTLPPSRGRALRPGGRALGTGFTAPQVPRAARPCMCCCCRCCSAARCSGVVGRPGTRTLAAAPKIAPDCWPAGLLALPDVPGAHWYCHQGLGERIGAKWGCCGCRLPDRKLALYGKGGWREGKDGGGGGSGGGISPAFTMQALLECSVALLARLRAQPALLEGFVTLLALPA